MTIILPYIFPVNTLRTKKNINMVLRTGFNDQVDSYSQIFIDLIYFFPSVMFGEFVNFSMTN